MKSEQNVPDPLIDTARETFHSWAAQHSPLLGHSFEEIYQLFCMGLTHAQIRRRLSVGEAVFAKAAELFRTLPGYTYGVETRHKTAPHLQYARFIRDEAKLFASEPMRSVIRSAYAHGLSVSAVLRRAPSDASVYKHIIQVHGYFCAVYFPKRINRAGGGRHRAYMRIAMAHAVLDRVRFVIIRTCPQGHMSRIYVVTPAVLREAFSQKAEKYIVVTIPLEYTERRSRIRWKSYENAWAQLRARQ